VAAASALIPAVAKAFSVDEFFAGKIVWLYMLPYGLAALLYGPLARSVDCKKILLYCVAAFALSNLLSGLAPHIYVLFSARALAGIAGAAIIPLSLILIARNSSFAERGRKVGGFFSLTFISSLLGLFLSGVMLWRWIFFLPAIGAGLVFLAVYLYFPKVYPAAEEKVKFNYLQVLSDKTVLRLFIYIFFISFLYHGVRQWLGVYFSKNYAFEQFLISMLLTTISLSGILGESLGGVLADKVGRRKIINLGAGIMLFSLAALLFKNVLAGLFAVMFIWGLGWTFNHSAVSTFLTDLPRKHLYESAGLNSSVRFLAGGLGAVAGGVLAQRSFKLEFIVFASGIAILLLFSRQLIIKGETNGKPAG
jgi:predicted MFS family arabinose efflux permease